MSIINICQNKRQELMQYNRDSVSEILKTMLIAFATFVLIVVVFALFTNDIKVFAHANKLAMVDKAELVISEDMKDYMAKQGHGKLHLLGDME